MINELDQHPFSCGLKISASKAKAMANSETSTTLIGKDADNVKSVTYLEQDIPFSRDISKETDFVQPGEISVNSANLTTSRTGDMK